MILQDQTYQSPQVYLVGVSDRQQIPEAEYMQNLVESRPIIQHNIDTSI